MRFHPAVCLLEMCKSKLTRVYGYGINVSSPLSRYQKVTKKAYSFTVVVLFFVIVFR